MTSRDATSAQPPTPSAEGAVVDPYRMPVGALDELLDGEPRYRRRQLAQWLARGVTDPSAMTDLPLALRDRLARHLPRRPIMLRHVTADGGLTHKVLLGLGDGEAIESVLLCYPAGERSPTSSRVSGRSHDVTSGSVSGRSHDVTSGSVSGRSHDVTSGSVSGRSHDVTPRGGAGARRARGRATVCISTQAGCAMGCPFCATGQAGLRRQLRTDEVVSQITAVGELLRDDEVRAAGVPDHVTNVVFMGMGEPLANLDVTIATVRWLIDRDGFDLSARGVTVSTIGLVPGIRRLMALAAPITLAVSLHAPNDELRDRLVPVNRQHPLVDLLAACDAYVEATGRRMTFEYVLIDDVNAAPEHARELVALLRPRRAHVNLIPMNPTPAVPWGAPRPAAQRRFADILEHGGLTATIRHNRGTTIDAACGQLYANYQVASGRRLPAAERVLPLAPARAAAEPGA